MLTSYLGHLNELLVLQKSAVRHISLSHYRSHTEPLFKKTKILKIKDLISHSRASFVHQYRCGYLPSSFNRTFFSFVGNNINLKRRNDSLCVTIPELTYKEMHKAPYVMICQAWNSIPLEIKYISKHSEFKSALTEYYLSRYSETCILEDCRNCAF